MLDFWALMLVGARRTLKTLGDRTVRRWRVLYPYNFNMPPLRASMVCKHIELKRLHSCSAVGQRQVKTHHLTERS